MEDKDSAAQNQLVGDLQDKSVTSSLSSKIQVVAVVFGDDANQKEYHYFAPVTAKAEQYAAVYAASNSSYPFKIVRIVRDNVIDVDGRANKSIWGSFDESFAKEVQARTEHLARVKSQLEHKKRQFQEREMFAVMAQTDPEVANLLQELENTKLY